MTLATILTHIMALTAGMSFGLMVSALCHAAHRRDAKHEERDD